MKKLLLLSLLSISGCSSIDSVKPFDQQQAAKLIQTYHAPQHAQQMIALTLPNQHAWKKIDLSYGTVGSPIMLIPNQDSREHWQQSIRTDIASYAQYPNITLMQVMQQQLNLTKNSCQQVHHTVVAQNSQQIIYQITSGQCNEDHNLLRYSKALRGRDAIYVVYYSASKQISTAEIKRMSRAVDMAELVTAPSRSTSTHD